MDDGQNTEHAEGPMTRARCLEIGKEDGYKKTVWASDKEAIGDKCEFKTGMREYADPIMFTPGVTIPGSDYISGQPVEIQASTAALAYYIIAIFKYATGVIGIIAAVALMIAGVIWLTAGGNNERISQAKTMIASSLIGMLLAFGAFTVLATINPNLVELKITPIKKIEKASINNGCCLKTAGGVVTSENTPEEVCNPEILKGYDKLEFVKDFVAEENKCVEKLGCCHVQFNSYQFGFVEGPTLKELCFNKTYEYVCEEKSTSWMRSWTGGAGIYYQIYDASDKLFNGDIPAGDIDVEWQRGACQAWDECKNRSVAEPGIPNN